MEFQSAIHRHVRMGFYLVIFHVIQIHSILKLEHSKLINATKVNSLIS